MLSRKAHDTHGDDCHALVATTSGGPSIADILSRLGGVAEPTRSWLVSGRRFIEFRMKATDPILGSVVSDLEQARGWARLMGCYPDYDRTGLV